MNCNLPCSQMGDIALHQRKGFKDSRNKKSEEERRPKGVEEGEKGLSPSQKPIREQRKTGGPLPLTLESVMTTPTASTNRSTNVCYLAQKPRKSMSAPVFRTSHDPLVLLALPTFCSYQPQTPATATTGVVGGAAGV